MKKVKKYCMGLFLEIIYKIEKIQFQLFLDHGPFVKLAWNDSYQNLKKIHITKSPNSLGHSEFFGSHRLRTSKNGNNLKHKMSHRWLTPNVTFIERATKMTRTSNFAYHRNPSKLILYQLMSDLLYQKPLKSRCNCNLNLHQYSFHSQCYPT
jgi:hypothetical protein